MCDEEADKEKRSCNWKKLDENPGMREWREIEEENKEREEEEENKEREEEEENK